MTTVPNPRRSEDTVIVLMGAINGIAPSNTLLKNALSLLAAEGESQTAFRIAGLFASMDEARYAQQVLGHLGITEQTVPKASLDSLTQTLVQILKMYPGEDRGQITLNLGRILTGLETDSTYGAAARAWNSFKQSALDWANSQDRIAEIADLAKIVGFAINASAPLAKEGDTTGGTLVFRLSTDKPVFGPGLTLKVETLQTGAQTGQATAPSDYVATNATLQIAPGQSTAEFTVTLVGDKRVESDEVVRIVIRGDSVRVPVTATGTIINDDFDTTPPAASLAAGQVVSRLGALVASLSEPGIIYLVHESVLVRGEESILAAPADRWKSASTDGRGPVRLTADGLIEGLYQLYGVDEAGNLSRGSENAARIDNTPPARPTISGFAENSGSASDRITNDSTPTLTVSAESGTRVEVFRDGVAVGSGTATAANGLGTYVFTSPSLADGTYAFTAVATDQAENRSAASTSLTISVDTTAPAAPVIRSVTDRFGNSVGIVSALNYTVLQVLAEPNAIVTILRGGARAGVATAQGVVDGVGLYTFEATDLAEGESAFTATATDVAGNTGAQSAVRQVFIDTTPPVTSVVSAFESGFTLSVSESGTLNLDATALQAPSTLIPVQIRPSTLTLALDAQDAVNRAAVLSSGSPVVFFSGSDGSDELTLSGNRAGLLYGFGGNDTLSGSTSVSARDWIFGQGGDDLLRGEGGDDVVSGGEGNDTIIGGAGADTINAGSGTNQVTDAGQGTDTITHDQAASTVAIAATGTGAVTLIASQVGATATSAAGVNTTINASTSTAAVSLTGNSGNDSLTGGSASDSITAGDGDDTIIGSAGTDSLLGNVGNDRFEFASGEFIAGETVDGGAGTDSVVLTSDSQTITDAAFANKTLLEALTTGNGTNTITLGSTAAAATANLTVTGGSGADTINAAALGEAVRIEGGHGANVITGSNQNDTLIGGDDADTLSGGIGADTITSGDGNDSAIGGDGDDTIRGMLGNDTLQGGIGDDQLFGNQGTDFLEGGDGADFIQAGQDNDTAYGGIGNDTLDGGSTGDDLLYGENGDDIVSGDTGADTIIGGSGADILLGGSGNDHFEFASGEFADLETVDGGDGVDTVRLTANSQTIIDGAFANKTRVEVLITANGTNTITLGANAANASANLTVMGGSGADTLNASALGEAVRIEGGNGANVLTGSNQNDTLMGGQDTDTLEGGAGSDSLEGGEGNDIIIIGSPSDHPSGESINGGGSTDRIHFTSTAGATLTLSSGVNVEEARISNASGSTSGTTAENIDASSVPTSVGISLTGNDGSNQLIGNAADNVLDGQGGNDTLRGGAGADNLIGGPGDDRYEFNTGDAPSGGEILRDNAGTADTLVVITTTDLSSLYESTVIDAFNNVSRSVKLLDDSGIERILITSATTATFTGAQLTDQAIAVNATAAGAATLAVRVGSGTTVNLSTLTFASFAGQNAFDSGVDVVSITGATGNEVITGTSLADSINADAGSDRLTGSGGNDSLSGGLGADTFVFSSTGALNGTDTLNDLSLAQVDVLDFSAFLPNGALLSENAGLDAGLNGGAGGTTAFTVGSNNDVDIANKVVLFNHGPGAFTAADLVAEIQGAGNAFAVNGKAVVIVGDAAGGALRVFFVDSALDGNAGDVTTNDVVEVALTGVAVDLDALKAVNFNLVP